ncbi:MAG TPA: amino acid permease, partial [Xylella taiwanensis]
IVVRRRTRPDLPRPFRVPAYAVIAPAGAAACLYLFWQPFTEHWPLMVGWTVLGLVMYFSYSYHHSKLRRGA